MINYGIPNKLICSTYPLPIWKMHTRISWESKRINDNDCSFLSTYQILTLRNHLNNHLCFFTNIIFKNRPNNPNTQIIILQMMKLTSSSVTLLESHCYLLISERMKTLSEGYCFPGHHNDLLQKIQCLRSIYITLTLRSFFFFPGLSKTIDLPFHPIAF